MTAFGLSLAAGALLGFFYSNSRSQPSGVSLPVSTKNEAPALTPEEIKNAIAVADANPNDAAMQRKLGLGLYDYARQTPNAFYLKDLLRLLARAPQDDEVILALGHIAFTLGRQGETAQFAEARKHYANLLAAQPANLNARTALGLAYYFDKPSQTELALAAWRRVLQANPRHEGALQSLASALLETGRREEAAPVIQALAQANPQNPSLPDLQARLAK